MLYGKKLPNPEKNQYVLGAHTDSSRVMRDKLSSWIDYFSMVTPWKYTSPAVVVMMPLTYSLARRGMS